MHFITEFPEGRCTDHVFQRGNKKRRCVTWVVTKNYDVHSTALTLIKKPKELLPFARNANNKCATMF